MPLRFRRARGLSAAFIGLALSACVGMATPDGYVDFAEDGIRLARPEGWEDSRPASNAPVSIGWVSPPQVAATRQGLFVRANCTQSSDVAEVAERFVTSSQEQTESFELLEQAEVSVPGSDEAVQLDTTYVQVAIETDESLTVTQKVIFARSGPAVVQISVAGAETDFDEQVWTVARDTFAIDLAGSDLLAECGSGS